MQNCKTINLTIDSCNMNTSMVGSAIKGICAGTSLREIDIFNVEVSVVEAINNVIEHAYTGKPGNRIDVKVSLFTDKLEFIISDSGTPFEFNEKPSINFDPEDLTTFPENGMGAFIIKEAMDEVKYKVVNGKNFLTLIKFL